MKYLAILLIVIALIITPSIIQDVVYGSVGSERYFKNVLGSPVKELSVIDNCKVCGDSPHTSCGDIRVSSIDVSSEYLPKGPIPHSFRNDRTVHKWNKGSLNSINNGWSKIVASCAERLKESCDVGGADSLMNNLNLILNGNDSYFALLEHSMGFQGTSCQPIGFFGYSHEQKIFIALDYIE